MDVLDFIELDGFTDNWKRLGLKDDDLAALQKAIMADPSAAAVVPGTGSLRKIRFAPKKWKTGKSGAARIGYVYFEDYAMVLLVTAYAKNEQEDLSAKDKKAIKSLIAEIDKELKGGEQ